MNKQIQNTESAMPDEKIVIRAYEDEADDQSEETKERVQSPEGENASEDTKPERNRRRVLHIVYAILIVLAVCIVGYILSVIAYHMIMDRPKDTQPASSYEAEVSENQISDPATLSRAAENELYYADFLLPESSDSYLTASDLEGFSKSQLAIAKNEIYARHGLIFTDEEYAAYFESCKWYKGTITSVTDDMLNAYERANIALITKLENE